MRLGLIARMDKSGLGIQTRNLARLLQPNCVLAIDSSPFNYNSQQYDWYSEYSPHWVNGFPSSSTIRAFLEHIDIVLSCETFYNNEFTRIAKEMGVKTILIANYEFFDWHKPEWQSVPLPDKIILPSPWHSLDMAKYNPIILPTPIYDDDFKQAREANLKRKGKPKYLFMNGKTAVHDRSGLDTLYAALERSQGDYTVTVKAQHEVKRHPDPRLKYDFSNPDDQTELYTDYDALIHPRRYGGQSLSMNEALICGLPVLMPDVDPNNKTLPYDWLVKAYKRSEFMARTMIDVYNVEAEYLAYKMDHLDVSKEAKIQAYEIGQQFEAESLRDQYKELLS